MQSYHTFSNYHYLLYFICGLALNKFVTATICAKPAAKLSASRLRGLSDYILYIVCLCLGPTQDGSCFSFTPKHHELDHTQLMHLDNCTAISFHCPCQWPCFTALRHSVYHTTTYCRPSTTQRGNYS